MERNYIPQNLLATLHSQLIHQVNISKAFQMRTSTSKKQKCKARDVMGANIYHLPNNLIPRNTSWEILIAFLRKAFIYQKQRVPVSLNELFN
jgi:hypothetical protein